MDPNMHPEPQPIPDRSGRVVITAVVAAVIGALLAGATIFLWQQSRISSLESDLAQAREATQAATAQLSGLKLQVEELTKKADHEEKKADKEKKEAREAKKAEKEAKEAEKEAKEAESDLEGKLYGSFKSVGTSPDEIEVDVEQFLTGDAAKEAAKDAGAEYTNDYFIVNESNKLRTVPVASGTKVQILKGNGGSPKHTTVSYADFAKMFSDPTKEQKQLRRHGYWFWVTDGKITKIEEQFVP